MPIQIPRPARRSQRGRQPDGAGIALDEGLLARLLAETQAVAQILGEAMQDEFAADDDEGASATPVARVKDSRFRKP